MTGLFDQLETPCLIVDQAKMSANIEKMRAHLAKLGVPLRPHVKTFKNINIAREVLGDDAQQITVSTLKEAEYFLAHGIKDILYAVGIAPNKIEHVARLREAGADLKILVDSAEQARLVCDKCRELGIQIPTLIEIDCDGHRSGVEPGSAALVAIGKILHECGGPTLAGVLTHAGGSYDCRDVECIQTMAAQEREATVFSAETLRHEGLPCPIVSIGSTPTASFSENMDGVTEVRAGVYVFHDLVMAGLQVCAYEDIALSVLTSVIGHQREKGWVLVDAGWMAMSRDRGTADHDVDQGYGLVCREDGSVIGDLIISDTNQEHGIIAHRDGDPIDADEYPIGTLLRILPNHACATAAQHGGYHLLDHGILMYIERISGW